MKRKTYATRPVVVYPNKRPTSTTALTEPQRRAVDREVNRQIARKTGTKYTDLNILSFSVDFSGTVYPLLNNLSRGDTGKDHFDGDEIVPKWVQVRYQVNGSNSANTYNTVRVIIGQSFLLSTPSANLLLEATGNSNASLSAKKDDRGKDYKILYDKLHFLQSTGRINDGANVFIPGKHLRKVEFTSSGSLSITRGSIFILFISDDGLTDYPDASFYSRVKFSN